MSIPSQPWSAALPADGSAFPEDLVSVVWSYFQWDLANDRNEWAYPRSEAQLRALIHPAYQASLRSEEARPVRFQQVFDLAPSQMTVRFDAPLEYSVQSLVKLAPTIGVGYRWLVVMPRSAANDDLVIAGICDPFLSPHATAESMMTKWVAGMGLSVPEVSGIALSALGPGWLRVSTWSQRFFELSDCTIRFPFTIHEIEPVARWYADAVLSLAVADETIGRSLVRRIWGEVVRRVRDQRHGGCLLVVPDERSAATLPARLLYALGSSRIRDVVRRRMEVEPALSCHAQGKADIDLERLEAGHFLEIDVGRIVELIASLAAVDGAVILHRDLRLVGFGAEIIAGSGAHSDHVAYAEGFAPGDRTERALAAFGMRHRSAHRFCELVPGSLAFVVSQDGDVRVFANEGGRVVLYEGPAPEDWVLAR